MPNEAARLRSLNALKVLDSGSEERFDRITRLAADLFDAPIALVSLIDKDRQWFKSRVGVELSETPRSWAFCSTTITLPPGEVLVVNDASIDPRFNSSPLVMDAPHIRFYAGAPIQLSNGKMVGAVCVIDPAPREAPPEALLRRLTTLAAIAADELELRQAHAAALDQQRMLLLAESMAKIGHWRLSLPTRRLSWSDEVYRIHGREPDGQELDLDDATRDYDPESRARIATFMEAAARRGEPFNTQFRLKLADGKTTILACRGCLEQDDKGRSTAVYGVIQNVSEQMEMVQTITDQMARYRLITENANDVVTQIGMNGVVVYASPALTQLSGYSPAEVIGRSGWEFIHAQDLPIITKVMQAATRGDGNTRVEYRFRRKDGSHVWVESQPNLLRDPISGEITGYSDVIRDISERRHLEDALRAAREEAEAAAQVKAEFLANMSHELRTPLTSILGFGALIQKAKDLSPETRRYVDRVSSASQALLTTVNDILDFSKLEAGQVEIRTRPTPLPQLISETADLLRYQAEQKDIALIVDIEAASAPALVDPDRLRQILLNLIGNAVKFTARGEVRVSAALDVSSGRLRCRVEDTGIGIPPEHLARLFGRFAQVDGARNSSQAGTGLGLAICKGLVELMGGAIEVQSEPGRGSCFAFDIAAPVAARSDGQCEDEPGLDFAGFRVLIVDDHAANRDLVRVLLTPLGCDVFEASSGEAALERCGDAAYDLLIMDYRMPGMNGVETLHAIRARPGPNQWTPMVAFTASTGDEDRHAMLSQGFDSFASKPIEPRTLIGAMVDALTRPDHIVDLAG